jgi:anti-sigma B factor antagonist
MDILYQTLEADIVLIRLNGRLDATTSPEVRAILQKLLDKDQPKIIIDLEEVPFIDSSGLASLVSGLRLAREKNGYIALSGIQPQAQTVFHLTMLDRIFPIHPTYHDAKQSLI